MLRVRTCNQNLDLRGIGNFFIFATIISAFWGCTSQPSGKQTLMNEEIGGKEELAKALLDDSYGPFFNYYNHEETLDNVWSDSANHPLLYDIIADPSIDGKARFLAAEILFSREFTFVSKVDKESVAGIYAEALTHNYTEMGNSWGFLYEHNDAGPVGIRFEMIGEASIKELTKLLENSEPGPMYAGSKEATVGNGYQFRIKDYAAFYLGRIVGEDLAYYEAIDARDNQIRTLQTKLKQSAE